MITIRKYFFFLLILSLMACMCSCAFHTSFPFICLRGECIKNQFKIGGLKKRVKAKVFVMKRKAGKKQNVGSKDKYKQDGSTKSKEKDEERVDSSNVIKGRNVDYTRFYILFKLKADTSRLDTISVVHSAEYRTIIETDQSRLDAKLDSISSAKVIVVYVKEYPEQPAARSVIKKRDRSVVKYLHHHGIARPKIIIISQN